MTSGSIDRKLFYLIFLAYCLLRSSWTDTPQDKAKKQGDDLEPVIDIKKEAEIITLQKRDKQQEEIVKKSKRSSESLVDMHKKKMKEKKKVNKSIMLLYFQFVIATLLLFYSFLFKTPISTGLSSLAS